MRHIRRAHSASPSLLSTPRRWQHTRDQRRNQPGADPLTGNQTNLYEPPDLTPQLQFASKTLAHVTVPELDAEKRARSDLEKERHMKRKYGDLGPGERPSKNSATTRRDMLKVAQDVDGLPWEVRWRKTLIPSAEEMIQDIRDRFDLFVQDPMEREVQWYLHWRDRLYKMQPDRLIWPQGFTDYLDHYDIHGRRRVLPSAQKWTDTSWKYLADVQYKDRMWLVEGEDRRGVHMQLQSTEQLLHDEERRQLETADIVAGLQSGVIDLDEEQMYQALSGTADPLEVAKTKTKIESYQAEVAGMDQDAIAQRGVDPISGFPKASDQEKLPSGLSIEQATAIVGRTTFQREMTQQAGETATRLGRDPTAAVLKAHHYMAKKAEDEPMETAFVTSRIEQMKEKQQRILQTGEGQRSGASQLADIVSAVERQSSASPSPPSNRTTKEGFITVDRRPADQEPTMPREMFPAVDAHFSNKNPHPQKDRVEETAVPAWYHAQAVETDSMIRVYGTTRDPIEMQPADPRYQSKPATVPSSSSSEVPDAHGAASLLEESAFGSESVFDDFKIHKAKFTPELTREFQPLPTFKEAALLKDGKTSADGTSSIAVVDGEGKPLKRSERQRRERLARQKKMQDPSPFDADILLPSLPWETDSVADPYRGVAEASAVAESVSIHRPSLEATWKAYRDFFRQTLMEFNSVARTATEDQCITLLLSAVPRIRKDEVGTHPVVPPEQLEIIQLVFEGHLKQFISDFFKSRSVRASESKAMKSESEDVLRQASAKSKLLGSAFVNFVQEMVSLELDGVRQNPIQRYAILLREKRLEPIARPFGRWAETQLFEFVGSEYTNDQHLEGTIEQLKRSLSETRFKTPSRVEGVQDVVRDATIEALHHWCLGTVYRSASKHYMGMYLKFSEVRFRGKAEHYAENATEAYQIGYQTGNQLLTMPVPDTDPPYDYDEKEFMEGENAMYAELLGNFEKAERLWNAGTTRRWYPVVDETEYMWYLERRGRYTMAMDVSDRTLENLNKRTHPSIHQFPDRARPFLEGAPLTQETAEHLWLRNMGEVYMEHSQFMGRVGRFATAREYQSKALNFLHLAIREAQERLPASWAAPLLTRARFLGFAACEPQEDPEVFLKTVDDTMEKLYALENPKAENGPREKRHWFDPEFDLPVRVALVQRSMQLLGVVVLKVAERSARKPTDEELMKFLAARAKGGAYSEHEWFAATDAAAEEVVRKRILRWRDHEVDGSDAFLYLTHLYFSIRVQPKSHDDVQKYWEMYEPVFSHIYTRAALASRARGVAMIGDALRRICQILLPGSKDHHAVLLGKLTTTREKLSHLIDRKDADRTINALEAHMANKNFPSYVYGTAALHRSAVKADELQRNQTITIDFAAKDYKAILGQKALARSAGENQTPRAASQEQGSSSSGYGSDFGPKSS